MHIIVLISNEILPCIVKNNINKDILFKDTIHENIFPNSIDIENINGVFDVNKKTFDITITANRLLNFDVDLDKLYLKYRRTSNEIN